MRQRLDQELVARKLVASRSQAESYIKLGQVQVNGQVVSKSGMQVGPGDKLVVTAETQYVSRAALKLASVAKEFGIDFSDKVVLDIGSSTGGFTQYALHRGARKVIAVEVGTNQLHPTLHGDTRIELHEQTDFRKFQTDQAIDIFVADVSFISLRDILPQALRLGNKASQYAVMVKPQFEAGDTLKHKGVIKNDKIRRDILKEFEVWVKQYFVIKQKADSKIAGSKGNVERFYILQKLS